MRIVIAEDSVLLRAGLDPAARSTPARTSSPPSATPTSCSPRSTATSPTWPWSTCACRRPTPTTASAPPSQIRERWPDVAILVLSQYVEERYATELLAGDTSSVGYLLKDRIADVSEFLGAVRRVATAAPPSTPRWWPSCWPGPAGATRSSGCRRGSPRCSALMAEGRTNPAIARQLVVSDKAVEKHVGNIFLKLDLPPAADDHRRVLAVLRWLEA